MFLIELRRCAGDTPSTARIKPMQWVAIAKDAGLTGEEVSEAITCLRAQGLITFTPQTTDILALSPAGISVAAQLMRQRPRFSDPMPNTLDEICAELDF